MLAAIFIRLNIILEIVIQYEWRYKYINRVLLNFKIFDITINIYIYIYVEIKKARRTNLS